MEGAVVATRESNLPAGPQRVHDTRPPSTSLNENFTRLPECKAIHKAGAEVSRYRSVPASSPPRPRPLAMGNEWPRDVRP